MSRKATAMAAAVLALSCVALAQDAKAPAVVCNVKVLSDKVKDVSNLEAWKKSYLKDGMTDKEKALAIWESIVAHQYQDTPPNEYIQNEDLVLDPIKIWNVYGYSFCGVAASEVQALARYTGLKARGWTIVGHVVPEVWWNDSWHLLDASLVNYFPKPDKDGKPTGDLASVAEISKAVQDWLKDHPELKGSDPKLREFGWAENKTAWKKLGPQLLSCCPFYNERGWWPAKTHGWYSTMQEYDGKTLFEYECGFSMGYQCNIQLRQGEKLTRNWSNKGLHVNGDKGAPGCIKADKGDLQFFTGKYGDLAPGRVGNGTLDYSPTADGALEKSALVYENLGKLFAAQQPASTPFFLGLMDKSKPGLLVIGMPSSYVYLSGQLELVARGKVAVSFSDNNGLDWKPLELAPGAHNQKIDLTKLVFRRYDYQLRFELTGEGAQIGHVNLTHDIQHSQRPLPALDNGENTITLAAGPQEATITVEGSVNEKNKDKQLVYTDFHPTIDKMNGNKPAGPQGSWTFPVATPGEMTRLRLGAFWRAWGTEDGVEIAVSYDEGKTFKVAQAADGSTAFNSRYVEVKDMPAGTKAALVRFTCIQKSTIALLDFNINADYKQPNSGFRPVKVTYAWEEGGQEKADEHVAKMAGETWKITCAEKPVMKSITLELAK